MSDLLVRKHVVVFGAEGSIGSVVAKDFAGVEVFLFGRNEGNVELMAKEIAGTGGRADEAVTDALDDGKVNTYIVASKSKP